jgi:hypothetical protein
MRTICALAEGENVFLTKHDDGTTLAFVVAGEAWNNPTKVSSLEAIVREVAPTVGGLPVNMRLLDTQLQVKKDELIQKEEPALTVRLTCWYRPLEFARTTAN